MYYGAPGRSSPLPRCLYRCRSIAASAQRLTLGNRAGGRDSLTKTLAERQKSFAVASPCEPPARCVRTG
jgi:hypothetical protein